MDEASQNPQAPNQVPQSQASTPSSLPDASDLLRTAWESYKQSWKKYILILSPIFVAALVLAFTTGDKAQENPSAFSPLLIAITVAIAIIGIIAEAAILYSVVSEEKDVSISEAYAKGSSLFWQFLLVQFLVGVIVMLGFIALVLPGIYLMIKYSFSSIALVGEGKHGMAALRSSGDLVKGRWFEVFIRFVFVFVLSFIPFAVFFVIDAKSLFGQVLQNVLSLALAPLWILYVYGIYKALKKTVGNVSS